MSSYLVAALCFLALASAVPVQFKDCGSKTGHIKVVDVSNCDKFPCPLKRGSDATIKVTYTPTTGSASAKSVVHGIIAGLPVPFNPPVTDTCASSVPACPSKANTDVTFTATLPIQTMYPKLSLTVKWEVQDDNNQDLVCFMIPVVIV